MVLRASSEHDVQVFATTHSGDCVRGFEVGPRWKSRTSRVSSFDSNGEAGKIRAVEYSEEELETAAEQGIEVR